MYKCYPTTIWVALAPVSRPWRRQYWITTYELGNELSANHLAGKENVHVHHLSRLSPHYEWQLHPRMFKLTTSQLSLHWVTSTPSLFNQQVNDFYRFCFSNGLRLPDESFIIVSYMCHVANKSPRPQSVLKTTRAAVQHLHNALHQPGVLNCEEITLLQSALVKSVTTILMP